LHISAFQHIAAKGGCAVGDINLEVWDATGNKRLDVQVPDDVAVERILMVLVDKLHAMVGDPDKDKDLMTAASPVFLRGSFAP